MLRLSAAEEAVHMGTIFKGSRLLQHFVNGSGSVCQCGKVRIKCGLNPTKAVVTSQRALCSKNRL